MSWRSKPCWLLSLICPAVPREESQGLWLACLTEVQQMGCVLTVPRLKHNWEGPQGAVSWDLLQHSWGFEPPAAISLLIHALQVLNPHSHKLSLLWGS